jgi:hypothetical protein
MKIKKLGNDAYAWNILKAIMDDQGYWLDISQVYHSISVMGRKMARDERYIEEVGERASRQGPKQKIYCLTPAGEAALQATIIYHRQLADYLMGTGPTPDMTLIERLLSCRNP